MGFAMPAALGMSELETLRVRCTEQAQQIQRLETEILQLRGIKPEQVPVAKAVPEVVSPPAKAAATGPAYLVQAGDSLDKIARKNGSSAEKLAKANGLELTSILHIGQKLVLPGKEGKSAAAPSAAPAESPGPRAPDVAAKSPSTTPPAIKPPAAEAPSSAANPPSAAGPSKTKPTETPAAPETPALPKVDTKKTHAVRIETEITYGDFAIKHGTTIKRLNDLNGLDLTKATLLAKGSELYVPGQP